MSACAPTMVRVYNYMASGLALSGIVAFALFNFSELAALFFQVQGTRVVGLNVLGWVAIFAPLGLLLLVSFRAQSMSLGAVQAVYWAVTALMGVSLSLLLFRYRRCIDGSRLLRHGRRLRCAQPLRLHHQARPVGVGCSCSWA